MTRALVTGGNRGIGQAIAEGLRDRGLDVIVASRDGTGPDGCATVTMDLQDDTSMDAALAQVGHVDVLVNNAGVLWDEGLWDDLAHFDVTMAVMVRAPFRLMRALLPGMGQAGRVVNVSSGWGSFAEGLGGGGAYAVGKAALNALTVRAASQGPRGVKVNAMCPGWVRTRMGGPGATRTPEDGADTAIWLATLPDNGPTGGFFRDRRPIEW